jgi:phage gp36-like protein
MGYATAEDLMKRFDVGVIGDLCQDCRTETDEYDISRSRIVAMLLDEATGQFEIAVQAGGRYTLEQMATLTGSQAEHRKRIECTIAMANLLKRRTSDSLLDIAKRLDEEATAYLKRLQTGENVFGFLENLEASVLHHEHISAATIESLNLLPARMGRFFPRTASRTPRSS